MGFIVESYDSEGQQLLGSDGTMLAYELKTLRGCLARVQRFNWHRRAKTLRVYHQPYADRYADKLKTFLRQVNAPN